MRSATLSRIVTIARPFFASDLKWKARISLGVLLALSLSVNGLNVVNSYVGRDFMSALSEKRARDFTRMVGLYFAVFAASTVVSVLYRYTEQRLGAAWRRWLTGHLVDKYLTHRAYYRLIDRKEIDNPDQRVAEDVKTFTTTMLSFLLMGLNAAITFFAFAGVLWSIGWWLAVAAILYSAVGCAMTLLLGHRLVPLNNDQLRKEADLRFELIQVRARAYPMALAGQEGRAGLRLFGRLKAVIENFRAIIAVDRNIGFFVTLYNYLTPVLPLVLVAPIYMRGEIEFGVVTQAAMAFAQVTGALTLVVTQIDQASSFAAVIARLGTFWEAVEGFSRPSPCGITIEEADDRVAFAGLTLEAPRDGRVLIRDLGLDARLGRSLLISGPNGAAKEALFRATAGLWDRGRGTIARPQRGGILFLAQQPHATPGRLRDALIEACRRCDATDEQLRAALRAVGLARLLEGDGLDAERDWCEGLPMADRQRLAIAGLIVADPPFAFLNGATGALNPEDARAVHAALANTSITLLSIDDRAALRAFHADALELRDDGTWSLQPISHIETDGDPAADGRAEPARTEMR